MRTLVTGANGFIGRAVVARLQLGKYGQVRAARRGSANELKDSVEDVSIGDISGSTDWTVALSDVDVIVHTAARVHIMREDSTTQANLFDKVNVAGTINLARQAVRAGVTRLIFISSIKVNGEETEKGRSFSAADAPTPVDAYGQSKLAAENGLRAVSAETGLEVVIIRPVLVYGPGVKANFRSMMRWIERGIPLPLGAIKNARSLVAIDNLVDLIVTCLDHPSAPGEVFLVSDGEDLSTPQLLGRMGAAMKRPVRLLSVPLPLLSAAAILFGRTAYIKRLCGSLQVDIEKTRRVLGWSPPVSVDAALQMVARDVVEARSTAPMAMSNSGLQGPRG